MQGWIEQQPLVRLSRQPDAARVSRRRVMCTPTAAVRQPLLTSRAVACRRNQIRCSAACQHTEEKLRSAAQLQQKSSPAGTRHLPPGVEANNAVTLCRRQHRQEPQGTASPASKPAAAAEHAVAAAGASDASAGVQQAQPPAAAQPDAHQEAEAPVGSVLGAVALITGSTVGAGILALPSVAAPAGFGPSTATMAGCWVLLASQAMLLAEVNIGVAAIRRQAQQQAGAPQPAAQQMVTLRQMAGATLGQAGGAAASIIYLLLSFSLLTAYIAKAGEMVGSGSAVDPGIAGAGFTAALGGMMCFGGAATADSVNRWLTGALMLVFGGILTFGAGHCDVSLLTATADWWQAPRAVPIIFLALVFHDLVPVVCSQLGGDRRRVRAALLAGSALPLAMFVAWDATMLALTGEPGAEAATDPLAVLIADSGGAVAVALQGFSLLALATSFIGTCTGLTSTLQSEYAAVTAPPAAPDASASSQPIDLCKPAEDTSPAGAGAGSAADLGQGGRPAPQLLVYLAALCPPLAVASLHPGSFLTLLSAAGGYGMSFLYGVMPPLMAWQFRSSASASGTSSRRWLPGGGGMLAALCASAVAVEIGQAAMSCGWLS